MRIHWRERRAARRYTIGAEVVVVVHDAKGRERTLAALALDVSPGGTMIEAAHPIEPDALAWVDFKDSGTTAIAHVRHCTRKGGRFRIGFRFSSPPMRPPGSPAAKTGIHLVGRRGRL